ncbi:MAG: molecular chaperone DnaJ [Coriobacteriia bacterium]
MARKDYYDILGVKRTATADEVKKAFRRAARKHHPDTGGSEEAFKEVNAAYEVLSDPEKRAQYDQFGQYFPGPGGPGGPGRAPGGPPPGGFQNVDLGDLFGGVFSGFGGSAAGSARRGGDLQYDVTLTFDEALRGVSRKVEVRRAEECGTCHGTGAKPGTSPVKCPNCGGVGHVTQGQGLFGFSRPCPRCGGKGSIVEEPCATCRGKGQVVRVKPVTVNIPAGVAGEGKIRFKGKGEPGSAGGPAGDLYVVTHVAPHPYFSRDGADVLMDLPVTVTEAALGATLTIPTPDGAKVKLKITEGTQDGSVHRLAGRGVPRLKGKGNGDLKVRIKVSVPTKLSGEQKELLKRFASSREDEDVRAHVR